VGACKNQLAPYDKRHPNVHICGCFTCPYPRIALAETAMVGAAHALRASGEEW
jgi:hypothetical protein